MKLWNLVKEIYKRKGESPHYSYDIDTWEVQKLGDSLSLIEQNTQTDFKITNVTQVNAKPMYKVILKESTKYISMFISEDRVTIEDIEGITTSKEIEVMLDSVIYRLDRCRAEYLERQYKKNELKTKLNKELMEL